MEKPILLIKEEFTKNIVESINHSGLPFFIIESILKDVLNEVHGLTQKEYEKAKEDYEKSLNDDTTKESQS